MSNCFALGCGNGRYLGIAPQVLKIGCDRSSKLMEIAKARSFETLVCDGKLVPYRSQAFDVVLCIAMLHHISSLESRIQIVRELKRITRIGGSVVIYVWSMEQNEKTFGQQDLFVPWHLPTEFSKTEPIQIDIDNPSQAAQIPSDGKYTVYQRFYHVFKVRLDNHHTSFSTLFIVICQNGELLDLIARVGDFEVVEQGLERGNYFIIAKRLA